MRGLLNTYFLINNSVSFNKHFIIKKRLLFYNNFFFFFFFLKHLFKFNVLNIKKNDLFINFAQNKGLISFCNFFLLKFWRRMLNLYCGYAYSRIFVKVGLGFRKKYLIKFGTFCMNIGVRKWVLFKLSPISHFFNLKKRNLFLFVNNKRKLYFYLTHFKTLRKETLFKFKGILSLIRIMMNRKISRSILFARRVKFKKFKLKLTKKQKQRK